MHLTSQLTLLMSLASRNDQADTCTVPRECRNCHETAPQAALCTRVTPMKRNGMSSLFQSLWMRGPVHHFPDARYDHHDYARCVVMTPWGSRLLVVANRNSRSRVCCQTSYVIVLCMHVTTSAHAGPQSAGNCTLSSNPLCAWPRLSWMAMLPLPSRIELIDDFDPIRGHDYWSHEQVRHRRRHWRRPARRYACAYRFQGSRPQIMSPGTIFMEGDAFLAGAAIFSVATCGGVNVTINDPGCTAKTFPAYFDRVASS
jgi:hypothetical protein